MKVIIQENIHICNIKVVYSSSHVESTVTLDSQLHRDYYTILHLPFFGSVNKSPTQRLTMN